MIHHISINDKKHSIVPIKSDSKISSYCVTFKHYQLNQNLNKSKKVKEKKKRHIRERLYALTGSVVSPNPNGNSGS